MKSKILFKIAIFVAMIVILLGGVSNALAEDIVTTDAIAGTWYGNMHFSGVSSVQRVALMIPAGCEPGSVCGSLLNYPVQCTWEITYDGYSGGAYQYHFSNTLDGNCPAGSTGSLSLLPDGTLYRTHQTLQFIATGYLSQLPSALK